MTIFDPSAPWPVPFHSAWNSVDTTKINCLCSCPRKYFYEYVLGWRPDVPSNHLVFGSAVHLALEHLLLNGYDKIQEAHDLFLNYYRRYLEPSTDEIFHPKTPLNFLIVLTKYASKYKHDLKNFDVLYTEIAGTISIDEDVDLAFRMDSVLRNSSGVVSSLEHKTSSSTYLWADQWPLSFQVGTYSHVLNCLFPDEPNAGIEMNGLFFFKSKKPWEELSVTGSNSKYKPPYDFMRYPIKKDNNQMMTWQWNMLYYFNQLKFYYNQLLNCSVDDAILLTFPMSPGSCRDYAKLCSYYDFCCAWPNPLKRCQEPPIGFSIDFWDPLKEEAKHEFTL